MNFALMFALALGIDYALFIVMRFRGAFFGTKLSAEDAVAETMDTAGKAVLFSGVTVLISLTAVMLVPSPAFRSMALGIMLSVIFVLAATLTLLPAVLAKLGPKVDNVSLPWVHSGEHRSPRFAAWAERLWSRPLAYYGLVALLALVALDPCPQSRHRDAVDQGRARPRPLAPGLHPDPGRIRRGSTRDAPGRRAEGRGPPGRRHRRAGPGNRSGHAPQPGGGELALIQGIPKADPSGTRSSARRSIGFATACPPGAGRRRGRREP